jgi:outer membrane protein OmpA-like peptidoglycan-associated protein
VLTVGEASFFDFNKPTVRPEAARILDRLIVTRLQDLSVSEVKLLGHADPIGRGTDDNYNITLSKARARAVAEVITHPVPGQAPLPDGCHPAVVPEHNQNNDKPTVMLCIEGNGSAESDEYIVKICSGKSGEALKACYQPLRRVDVEITGDLKSQ